MSVYIVPEDEKHSLFFDDTKTDDRGLYHVIKVADNVPLGARSGGLGLHRRGGLWAPKSVLEDESIEFIRIEKSFGSIYGKRNKFGSFDIHRENYPAVVSSNTLDWWREGKNHREDGPAHISRCMFHTYIGFILHWCKNDLWHREGGPATITEYGQTFYLNHKLHREDGPAIISWEGTERYFLNGKELDYHGFSEIQKRTD